MKGDFTRRTFRRKKHYKSVRMQQGRVQIDADWNEQVDILLHRIETGTRDLLGSAGGTTESNGFEISSDANLVDDFWISPGRYYVSGVLCENDEPVTLRAQPDRRIDGNATDIIDNSNTYYLVYLDVWMRHITALDDTELPEPALGGVDTTTRAKTVWQVRCMGIGSGVPDPLPAIARPTTTGMLEAYVSEAQRANSLYRIEVHDSGEPELATFKWSPENGAVVAQVVNTSIIDDLQDVKQISLIEGDRRFVKGDWVEIITDGDELEGRPGTMCRIQNLDSENRIVDFETEHCIPANRVSELRASGTLIKMRRWGTSAENAPEALLTIPALDSTDPSMTSIIDLDNGIQLRFTPGNYQSGDYWYVPVRTGPGDLNGPRLPAEPDGVTHHVAPLAIVHRDGGSGALTIERDLRQQYVPQGEDRGLMYAGGDGQVSPRGTVLPEPLAVYVTGYINREGISVRYALPDASSPGLLYKEDPDINTSQVGQKSLDVATNADGLAICYWRVEDDPNTGDMPVVTATLADSGTTETGNTLTFNAWLSNADKVRFYLSERAKEALSDSSVEGDVQQALDNLYDNAAIIHYVGGDGQSGNPGELLPYPLRVRVGDGKWATGTGEPRVAFRVESGGGSLAVTGASGSAVDGELIVDSNGIGVFECRWTLGNIGTLTTIEPQAVEAVLILTDANGVESEATTLRFGATLNSAPELAYENSAHNASVTNVSEALDDLYTNVTRLHYIGGDGQSTNRGELLAKPLEVQLSGQTPASGFSVSFALPSGAPGTLYDRDPGDPAVVSGTSVAVATDANGMARCYWRVEDDTNTGEVPAVTASVVDGDGVTYALTFNAWLDNADRSNFYLSERAKEALSDSSAEGDVQQALDNLYDNAAIIHYVGGDGQSGNPGEVLPYPLRVRVGDGKWATGAGEPKVVFRVKSGGGELAVTGASGSTVDGELIVDSNGIGVFECRWTLGDIGTLTTREPQEVEAVLVLADANGVESEATTLRFGATLDSAPELAYENSAHNASVTNVSEALDDLYTNVTRLHYIGGEGQSTNRGELLAKALEVQLTGQTPASGFSVSFALPAGAPGTLYDRDPGDPAVVSGSSVAVATDANGMARCYWRVEDDTNTGEVPAVTASVVDGDGVTHAVTFNAWLGNADRSNFYLSERAKEALSDSSAQGDVQKALDNLYDNAAIIHYVGGDGQSGNPGEVLPYPLRVRVGDGKWATGAGEPKVVFRVKSGGGELAVTGASGSEVDGELIVDGNGIGVFECTWTLGAAGTGEPQEVEAVLVLTDANNVESEATTLHFGATLDSAPELAYENSAHNASVTNVSEALDDLYSNVTRLHYIGGDGQTVNRGEVLPLPLEVELTGQTPASGFSISFALPTDAPGLLYDGDPESNPGAASVAVAIDENGMARCYWRVEDDPNTGDVPAVTASVVDGDGVTHAVTFNAWLGNADRSNFYMSERAKEALSDSSVEGDVQKALDNLYDNAAIIHYVGGDGQSGNPGEVLPYPLRVRVGDGKWATGAGEPRVVFRVKSGGGELAVTGASGSQVDGELIVDSNGIGVFECTWTLGAAGTGEPQEVEAVLILTDASAVESEATTLHFGATLDAASELAYQNSAHNASVTNVTEALDDLYSNVTRLHYIGGGGQTGNRGAVLPLPLAVELAGQTPANGFSVSFALPAGAPGTLYDRDPSDPAAVSGTSVAVATDANGMARCYWQVEDDTNTGEVPAVTASVVDGEGTTHTHTFNAWLRDADKVHVALSERAKEALLAGSGDGDVQQALDNLYDNAGIIHYVGGDGQSGNPGEVLPYPLRVRVGDGKWATGAGEPRVVFRVKSGGGELAVTGASGSEVDGELIVDGNGIGVFECTWTLGAIGTGEPQEVEAVLMLTDANAVESEATTLRFGATLNSASELAYTNAQASGVTTVAGALDRLFAEPVPVGTIIEVASATAIASATPYKGFLLCDGATVLQDQYLDLYDVIRNTWNATPPAGEFGLPALTSEANLYKLIKY